MGEKGSKKEGKNEFVKEEKEGNEQEKKKNEEKQKELGVKDTWKEERKEITRNSKQNKVKRRK